MSAHLKSSHLFSPLLTSSKLFLALLTSSQLISALVTSSQLILRSSQPFSGPQPAPTPDLGATATKNHKKYDSRKDKNHQKLIVETLAQSVQCDLQAESCKRPWNYVSNSNIEQLRRSHSNAFASSELRKTSELQKTIELPVQQQRRATLMQPLQCNLQAPGCRSQWIYVGKTAASPSQNLLQNQISAPKPKIVRFL